MVGTAPEMRAAFVALRRAAQSDSAVLLSGETGSGKELAARSLHRASVRCAGPFEVVECAAGPIDGLESELFGHGGAGAFERARGGSIFLHEVGQLGIDLQPKLLRAIERRQIKRVDGMHFVDIDVRVIAATQLDLLREVQGGRFRADLYYRIAVIAVHLPPLRARAEDLPLLVDHFLAQANASERPEAEALRQHARGALVNHSWPGNVRELANWVERCVSTSRIELPGIAGSGASGAPLRLRDARKRWIDEFEQRYLRETLDRHADNVSAAARAAGVDRKYFHRLLVKHGMR
jgi:DNA-binding NtrC family response regulator